MIADSSHADATLSWAGLLGASFSVFEGGAFGDRCRRFLFCSMEGCVFHPSHLR